MSWVPKVRPMSKVSLHNITDSILKRWYPERLAEPGPLDVLDLFEQLRDKLGLRNEVVELPYGIEGRTWPDGRVQVSEATYWSAARDEGRARFTIAHEAGHAILHRGQISSVLEDGGEVALFRRADLRAFEDPEWQANFFAGAILMPLQAIRAMRRASPNAMAKTFMVSTQAAEVRRSHLINMGLMHE